MQLQLNGDLSIRKIDQEVFVYDRNRSLIHTFNETGAFLWRTLEEGVEKELMAKRLEDEYEVDADTATADVDAFISAIHTIGLVVSVP